MTSGADAACEFIKQLPQAAQVVGVVGALAGALGGSILLWEGIRVRGLKKELAEAEKQIQQLRKNTSSLATEKLNISAQRDSLVEKQEKLLLERTKVRNLLEQAGVVQIIRQPVLLVGPIGTGKTSLMNTWHRPWSHQVPDPSAEPISEWVPVVDSKKRTLVPHFAFTDLKVPAYRHFGLQVFDFPGDISFHDKILSCAIREGKVVRNSTGFDAGLVLVCLFNAGDAISRAPKSTRDYYNSSLFRKLNTAVATHETALSRVVVVFNHFDRLRSAYPTENEDTLLERCSTALSKPLEPVLSLVGSRERCAIFSVLGRDPTGATVPEHLGKGAPAIKGEAIRPMIDALSPGMSISDIIGGNPETYAVAHSIH